MGVSRILRSKASVLGVLTGIFLLTFCILNLSSENVPVVPVITENWWIKSGRRSILSNSDRYQYSGITPISSSCGDKILKQLQYRTLPSFQASYHNHSLSITEIHSEYCQSFFIPPKLTAEDISNITCYKKKRFNEKQRRSIRSALRIIIELFQSNGINVLLDRGSLIGSWRYHDMIPYDNNLDIRIFKKDRQKVKKIFLWLQRKSPKFHFMEVDPNWFLKIGCFRMRKREHCLTIINILDMTVKDNTVVFEDGYELPVDVIFPFRRRPFMGLLIDAPNRFEQYYKEIYSSDLDSCESYDEYGDDRKGCRKTSVDCRILNHYHPYIIRFFINQSRENYVEFLVKNGKISHVFSTTLLL